MRISSLLVSGALTSATLGLFGCGGGGMPSDEPAHFPNVSAAPAATVVQQQGSVAESAASYNARRDKELVAAGAKTADKPDADKRPGDLVGKRAGDKEGKGGKDDKKDQAEPVAKVVDPRLPTREQEYGGLQTQCKKEEYFTGSVSDFCQTVNTLMAPPPPSISSVEELDELQKKCSENPLYIAADVKESCKRNADLLQMFQPG